MLSSWIRVLQNAGFEPDDTDLADILWLAGFLPAAPDADAARASFDAGQSTAKGLEAAHGEAGQAGQAALTQTVGANRLTQAGQGAGGLPAARRKPAGTAGVSGKRLYFTDLGAVFGQESEAGLSLRSPGKAPAQVRLALRRALRPLLQRVESTYEFEMDEEATAQSIADTGVWLPVMRPAMVRAQELDIIVDEAPSMLFWERLVTELVRLLENLGAFTSVQVWSFWPTPNGDVELHAGWGAAVERQRPHPPGELVLERGNRVVLILSDCVASYWYDGTLARRLADWGRTEILTLLQMLPFSYWQRTGLANAAQVYLRFTGRGQPSSMLRLTQPARLNLLQKTPRPQSGLRLPVLTLEPDVIGVWARAVMGRNNVWVPGMLLPLDGAAEDRRKARQASAKDYAQMSPEMALVERFRRSATPEAWELACILSAVPALTLAQMGAVQRRLLPNSRIEHLSECYLGGLIRPVAGAPRPENGAETRFEFRPGVRGLLLSSLSIPQAAEIFRQFAVFKNQATGQPVDFNILVADDAQAERAGLDPQTALAVDASGEILERLGGSYARLGARLARMPVVGPGVSADAYGLLSFEPETIEIPLGRFIMGREGGREVAEWEKPAHAVDLPSYRIGKYPVTNRQFVEFIRQTGSLAAPEMGWDGQSPPPDRLDYPVTGVTWYQAMAYCAWLSSVSGRRYTLPNEAQWEKAARGVDGRLYPWGNDWQTERCNPDPTRLTPVDRYPAQNDYGVFDMAGNAPEWTLSLWGEGREEPRFTYPWAEDERNDPKAGALARRIYRGGAGEKPEQMTCTARGNFIPDKPGPPGRRFGFRVALAPSLRLRVMQTQTGECLIVEDVLAERPTHILVDGGPPGYYGEWLYQQMQRIRSSGGQLDLVVASHGDMDRMAGLLDLFESLAQSGADKLPDSVHIAQLWRNPFDTKRRSMALLGGQPNQPENVLGVPSNAGFPGGLIALETARNPVRVGGISVWVLGPTQSNLEKMRQAWLAWMKKAGQDYTGTRGQRVSEIPYRPSEEPASSSAYEVEASSVDEDENEFADIDAEVAPEPFHSQDASVSNRASIILLLEAEGRRILLTGDAAAEDIVYGLKKTGLMPGSAAFHVDILKLPHMGSRRSVYPEFFDQVTADTYVICANGMYGNPDSQTLHWLVDAAVRQQRDIQIVCTGLTPSLEKFQSERPPAENHYRLVIMDPSPLSIVL